MSIRLGKFQLPNNLIKDEDSSSPASAKFVVEPFETGFGHTIGNAFRRILLSSIEGAAISSVKIDGVDHEFQSVEGILEDVIDIVLNLKKVLLKTHSRDTFTVIIDVEKEGAVTADDIADHSNLEVVNPDQVICHLENKRRFYAELEVRVGRGYCTAEDNKKDTQSIGVIPIDCLFSPVVLVNYSVEETRVGQITDYDKLILQIDTDGRLTPEDALKQAASIFSHHLSVFDQINEEVVEFEEETCEDSEEDNRLRKLLNMSVNEIELSVRAANCLNNANLTTVGELAIKSEQEMLKYRNFGKKSLNEIKAKMGQLGLSLGMSIDQRLLESID